MTAEDENWLRCKQSIGKGLEVEDAAAWLPSLELSHISPERAVLSGVPNTFFRNRIQQLFAPLLRECLMEAFSSVGLHRNFRLELKVSDDASTPPPSEAGAGRPALTGARPQPDEAAAGRPVGPGGKDGKDGKGVWEGREARHFHNIIAGPPNQLALDFAVQVAAEPGGRFNPLYITGSTGSGKTHLLQSIAHETALRWPELTPLYITAEGYTNAVVDGIRLKKMHQVRERFRSAGLLLVDDLEFIMVSKKAQMELLHTFDALIARGVQTVFSADRLPGELTSLDPALRSRLEAGLVTELALPDRGMRLRMLRERARAERINLPEPAVTLLAERITTGFRRLEGAFVRLVAYSSMLKEPITAEFVERVAAPFLDPLPREPGLPLSAELILGAVGDHFGLTIKALRSRQRTPRLSQARRTAAYLLRQPGGLSYPEIGALLGNRAHSTILQAVKTLEEEMKGNETFKQGIMALGESLLKRAPG